MTIRTKIWLIAVSVAVAVGVASWARMYADAQPASSRTRRPRREELAHDIAEDLKSVQADADDRDLEEKLLGYLNRHSRIVRLDLYVYREAYTPSSRIAAPRGDRPGDHALRAVRAPAARLHQGSRRARRRTSRSSCPSTCKGRGRRRW